MPSFPNVTIVAGACYRSSTSFSTRRRRRACCTILHVTYGEKEETSMSNNVFDVTHSYCVVVLSDDIRRVCSGPTWFVVWETPIVENVVYKYDVDDFFVVFILCEWYTRARTMKKKPDTYGLRFGRYERYWQNIIQRTCSNYTQMY